MDLVSVDYSTAEAEPACRCRIKALAEAYKRSKAADQYRSRTKEVERLVNSTSKSVVRRDATRKGQWPPHFISGLAHILKRPLEFFILLNSTRDKPLNIVKLASSLYSSLPVHVISGLAHTCKRSLMKFLILNRRAWRQVTRDKPLNIARLASSLFSSLLFGTMIDSSRYGLPTNCMFH